MPQHKWQCINVECDYKEFGQKGDKCPKCGRSFYKVSNAESKRIFGIKDRYEADPNSIRTKNKRFNAMGSVLIGYFVSGVLAYFLRFLPDISLLPEILAIFIIILGGLIATYISRTNKAIIGLYYGLLYSISALPLILIFKVSLSLYLAFMLILIPILGFIGGYFGKELRARSDTGKRRKNGNERTKVNGYLICVKCGGYYKLQPSESPEDFEECDCGGKLEYHSSNTHDSDKLQL
jgi:hypothetical protein